MYKYYVELKAYFHNEIIYADRERVGDGWLYLEISRSTATGTVYDIVAAYELSEIRLWRNETLKQKTAE